MGLQFPQIFLAQIFTGVGRDWLSLIKAHNKKLQ